MNAKRMYSLVNFFAWLKTVSFWLMIAFGLFFLVSVFASIYIYDNIEKVEEVGKLEKQKSFLMDWKSSLSRFAYDVNGVNVYDPNSWVAINSGVGSVQDEIGALASSIDEEIKRVKAGEEYVNYEKEISKRIFLPRRYTKYSLGIMLACFVCILFSKIALWAAFVYIGRYRYDKCSPNELICIAKHFCTKKFESYNPDLFNHISFCVVKYLPVESQVILFDSVDIEIETLDLLWKAWRPLAEYSIDDLQILAESYYIKELHPGLIPLVKKKISQLETPKDVTLSLKE
jgi:hypothetical protein